MIADLGVVDAKLNADARSGSHQENGDAVDELTFGICETGVNAATEKAELKIELSR